MTKKKRRSKAAPVAKKQLTDKAEENYSLQNGGKKYSTPQRMETVNLKDSFQLETPVKLFRVEKYEDDSLYFTPVQRKNSLNPNTSDGTVNEGNLIFDFHSLADEDKFNIIKQTNKLHYSGKIEKTSINNKTTEVEENLSVTVNNLMETPKLSRGIGIIRNQMNMDLDLQQAKLQNAHFEDSPLFSSPLFSTPIQKEKFLNCLADSISKKQMEKLPKEKLDSYDEIYLTPLKDGTINNTPRSRRILNRNIFDNINVNTPPIIEKTMDKENSVWILGSEKKINPLKKKVCSKDTSPSHSGNILNCEKKNFSSGFFIHAAGIYETIMNKIKRCSSASAEWSSKVIIVCLQLGTQIKQNVTSLYDAYDKCFLNTASRICNNCDTYKMDITTLNLKIDSLCKELKNKDTQIHGLVDEMKKVTQLLAELKDLPSEVKFLKQQVDEFRTASKAESQNVLTIAPPPPPPPPAPPPPPPPVPLSVNKSIPTFERSKSALTLRTKLQNDKSRPVISLEELLSVKLKKPSERPSCRSRRTSSTALEENIIKKVARPMLSTIPGETNSPVLTSSAGNLNRLLLQDRSPVWRLKRLKRVGHFSLDCLHRKTSTVSRIEERERVNN